MKKIIALVLTIGILLVLTACGTTTETTTEEGIDATKVVVIIPGTLGDKSYFDGVAAGMNNISDIYGDQVDIKINEVGREEENWLPSIYDAAEGGFDLVITITPDLATMLNEVAPKYTDVDFLHIDGSVDYDNYDLANVATVETPPAQPSFIAGVIAALKSPTGNLGFVGGMDIVPIHEFLVPFIQGALYVNPDVTVQVGYTNDWGDAAAGKALADTFVENGADMLWAAAGGAGLGIFDTAVENDGVLALGVDSDQYTILKDSQPEKADLIVSSLVKGITPILEELFRQYFAGEFPVGERTAFLLEHHGMYMVDNENYYRLMSDDEQQTVLEAEAKIVSGEITVMDVYSMDASAIQDYVNEVAPN